VASVRAPRSEDAAHAREHAFKVGGFLLQQRADVDARRGPRATKCNDVLDLRERQAESTSLTDEREQPQHVGWVAPVAGRLTTGRREDAPRLVQPQRLAAQAAASRHLSDEQSSPFHEGMIGLPPRGKVKCCIPFALLRLEND
jgi:hypothetical protein